MSVFSFSRSVICRNSNRTFLFFCRSETEESLFETATDMDEELLNKTPNSKKKKEVFSLVLHSALSGNVKMHKGDILISSGLSYDRLTNAHYSFKFTCYMAIIKTEMA